eukprot:GHVT01104495.1.p1 GENE.GHVT01104495.1~~GHVT01104495.1.p1  ORF type:complete len:378 (-),score=76.74 GHVT01104495.1:664-1797(-)
MNLILFKASDVKHLDAKPHDDATEHHQQQQLVDSNPAEDAAEDAAGTPTQSAPPPCLFEVSLPAAAVLHCRKVLNVQVGSPLRVGVRNGGSCEGTVSFIQPPMPNVAPAVRVRFNEPIHQMLPADPVPSIDLVVATPRPKTFSRLLQISACLGVRRLIFVCSQRVERSYMSSPRLTVPAILRDLQLGLEQGVSTRFPDVYVYATWQGFLRNFHAHAEEASDAAAATRLVADPSACHGLADMNLQSKPAGSVMFAIGPEGGWVDDELEDLQKPELAFRPFNMGPRILRCETALTALHAQASLLLTHSTLRSGRAAPPPPADPLLSRLSHPSARRMLPPAAFPTANARRTAHVDEDGVFVEIPNRAKDVATANLPQADQ